MYLPQFLRCVDHLLLDLAIVVSSWCTLLIFAVKTLMDGLVSLYLQECISTRLSSYGSAYIWHKQALFRWFCYVIISESLKNSSFL